LVVLNGGNYSNLINSLAKKLIHSADKRTITQKFNLMQNSDNSDRSVTIISGKETGSFRLLRYFTVISLASIVVTSLLLGGWVRQISVDNLIQSEERNNIVLTQVLANSVRPQFHQFIYNSSLLSIEDIRAHPKLKALDRIIIKIYNLDGLTIYSSDFKQIGESKKTHASFQKAISGEVVSKLSFRDKIYAQNELIQNINVISSYVPIRTALNNDIEGVFEVYKDVTPIIAEIDVIQTKIIAGVVGTLFTLFIVLYILVRHADKIIMQQSHAQQKITEQVRHVAFYDSLTGLPNRILFLERLEHALQVAVRGQKLVVLMFIDLDRFKQVNDNLGHEAGDQLLRQVASRFNGCIRVGDTVARISGDEFTIILENLLNIELATVIAQRVVNEMGQPFRLGDHEVFVTCSIGLSIYPFDDDHASSLVKKADTAMYYSKSHGRNSYHYYTPSMLRHGSKQFEIEKDLNNAIINSEFRVFFQPKVSLTDLSLNGMEALIRWQHPDKGLILPSEFIPVLEDTGMIIQVGEWILRESCRQTKQWQVEGFPPLRVAVNVSAIQFRQPDFFDIVTSILNETGLEAQYLELELTESCLIEDADEHINMMGALKKKGVMLTIDDFGTGYSSLSYLCKLPVDTLKIDRGFLRDMTMNREKRSVITAIISFAHGLRMDVVVEGVETLQQFIFVSAMRCTAVQGFLFSKPIPVDEFYSLLKSGGSFRHIIESLNNDGEELS
jgi:diguanylate cyclase (GGDEF)-like protein